MRQYVVISPCYEILRYGHDKIKNSVKDIHTAGRLAKFVFGVHDLIDPSKDPDRGNFRFEACQVDDPDILVFVDKNRKYHILKGKDLMGSLDGI